MLPDQTSGAIAVRNLMADALVWVAVWVGSAVALIMAPAGLAMGRVDLMVLSGTSAVVAGIGIFQRIKNVSRPLVILVAASTVCAVLAPIVSRAAQLAIIPALMLFILAGVFALPRKTASRFAMWCGLLVGVSLPSLLPNMTGTESAVAAILLVGVGVSAWRFLRVASDEMIREEQSQRILFDSSPVATLEEDFTAVSKALARLRARGVADLRRYLTDRPDEVRNLVSMIKIRRANVAAVRMIGAASVEELVESFHAVDRHDSELEPFIEQFVALWENRREVALDLAGMTLEGGSLEAVLHWSVPMRGEREDLSRVIVAISDITPRKAVEEQLAEAVETNQRLLNFEHALASCSRALLLGTGDDALEVALETLREATGADRAFLSVNFTDTEMGASSRVVNSTSTPEHEEDSWVGSTVPWSKYPTAYETLSKGKPFQHVSAEGQGRGWDRPLLGVPVFVGGNWVGTVGFVDITSRNVWSNEAVRMLRVAAPMLGTFWERDVTRQRLEELVRSKDRFVASVSHELRTPLAAVLGFAEELKDNVSSFRPEELTGMLELIADQSQEMANMVEDLLVSARADIGTISIIGQEVYLRSQAEAALVGLGSSESKTIRVVGGPGKVWADPARTRQIIRNLLTNAVRYGGSEVTIEPTEEGPMTTLSIRDNGPGLPESDWERIFEPYQRAHDTPSQPASIGLGLTVSRQLARLMGGDLTYHADGSTSVFRLTLPARNPGDETLAAEGELDLAHTSNSKAR